MPDKITVMVEDGHMGRLDELADRLRDAGMQVQQVLGSVGVITGTVTGARRSAIADVAGVAGVEAEQEFRLAPPDSGTQ